MYLMPLANKRIRKLVIETAVKTLSKLEFDSLAGTGLSGDLVGPIVAYELNKHYIGIRKPRVSTHCFKQFIGPKEAGKVIIIDDCTESGETLQRIQKLIGPQKIVGTYFWLARPSVFSSGGEIAHNIGWVKAPTSYYNKMSRALFSSLNKVTS